jgi:hypothetical protein
MSIGRFQFWFWSLAVEYNDLVSQGEDFGLKIGTSLEIDAK